MGSQSFWLTAHIALFVAFSFFAFSRNYANLAFGVDGADSFIEAIHQWHWTPTILGFSANPFQGLGDLWYGDNARLVPGYLLASLFFGKAGVVTPHYVVLGYTVFALELFLSLLVFARSLGLGWPTSVLSAWVLPLLAEPYFGYSLLYPILMSAPSVGTMMAQCLLLAATVNRLGRGSGRGVAETLRRNALPSLIFLLLLTWLVASFPFRVVLWMPAGVMMSLGFVIGAPEPERRSKLALLAMLSVIFLAFGPARFVYGLFSFTTPQFWSARLENTITDPLLVSILYGRPEAGPMGPLLVEVAVLGMILAVVSADRRFRCCALATLAFVGAILGFGEVALRWGIWRGPAPLYFEFLIWPLYVLFAVWGLCAVTARIGMLLGRLAPYVISTGRMRIVQEWRAARVCVLAGFALSMIIPVSAFAYAWATPKAARVYALPPSAAPLIDTLRAKLGIVPGGAFRGRVAVMDLLDKRAPVGWLELAARIGARYAASGNDYEEIGLWYYDIPTLFEYSPATSPAFFEAATRLLARPADPQLRNVIVLRKPDARMLGLFGVRFVLADAALPQPFQLVMRDHIPSGEVLSLYEVPDVNLGELSPTEVRVASDFNDALSQLDDPRFDAARSVVVFDAAALQAPLAPVRHAELRMVSGGLSLTAESAGRSLLVLPFEFSHCLQVRSRDPDIPPPQLLRVDAVETGVLFDRRVAADIEYFTGLFGNSFCRIRDARAFSRLLGANR